MTSGPALPAPETHVQPINNNAKSIVAMTDARSKRYRKRRGSGARSDSNLATKCWRTIETIFMLRKSSFDTFVWFAEAQGYLF